MARGGQSQGNLKMFFMNIRGLKKGEKIHFTQAEALGDKEYKKLENIDRVSGQVVKVWAETKQYEGESYDELKLTLKDLQAEEIYTVSCGLNAIGRGLVNALASVEGNLGELSLAVYTNKKGYPALYITHNDQKLAWKWDKAFTEKYIKKTTKKVKVGNEVVDKVESDLFELNEFFLKVWKEEIAAKVQSLSNEFVPEAKEPELVEEDGKGLPF